MKIEILHIEECPYWQEAGVRVRTALDSSGHSDVGVSYRLLRTREEAGAVPFAGSPTILVNGEDGFPTEGQTTELACRIYPTGSGFAGLPTIEQLLEIFSKQK